MTPQSRKQLIDSLADGDVSDADFLKAEAELSVDPQLRREYYDRVILSMLLQAEADSAEDASVARPPAAESLSWRSRWTLIGMAIATAASILALVFLLASSGDPQVASVPRTSEDEELASGFAVVSGQSDVVWQSGMALSSGSLVPAGELHLQSGIVQLELFSGVQLVVEGEAKFSVLSPMEVRVALGKVRAQVPEPAIGFRIRTQAGEVVDLGTDFAVDVSEERSEVHVLEGEVQWQPTGARPKKMEQGNAVAASADGDLIELDRASGEFVGPDELHRRLQADQEAKQVSWKEHVADVCRDPRLVAYYQIGLSDRRARLLRNRAVSGKTLAGEGAVVAAVRAPDRWGNPQGALDFSPTGSRVRLTVPGVHQSLTLLCWVRINSLDRWYNSLFLTDGHEKGEPHWQIMDDGRLFFSVKKNDVWDASKGEKDKHIYFSPPLQISSLRGQWLMIATVYDVPKRKVTHYFNGDILSEESIPAEYLVDRVRIGDASLCNWGLPERDEPRFAVRNLNGSMDEFALFSAALSSAEIKDLYEHGKP